MINQLKAQLKRFWKWIIALIFGGAVLAASALIPNGEIPSTIAEGQIINFPYTDENSYEKFIIYTDQEEYRPLWAWDGFDVYMAMENKSGKSQSVSFQSFFSKDFTIEEVFVLNPTATTTIKEPIYKDVCQEVATTSSKDTTTVCYQEKIGEKDKVVLGVWIPITQQEFSKEDYDKTISDNKIQVKPKIGDKVVGNFIDYSLKSEFSYYKLRVKANEPFSTEEFYIEAIGQDGDYGLLDPTIFTDDFNSYNDGDLHGQGDWTGDTDFDIQGVVVKEGAKAVKIDVAAGVENEIYKAGTPTTDGRITFYMRASNITSTYDLIDLRTSAGTHILSYAIRWLKAVIGFKIGGAYVALTSSAVADTWYCIEIEWRSSDGKFRARLDGGTYTDWGAPTTAGTPAQLWIDAYGTPGTHTFYLDYIAENPIAEPAVEPQMEVIIIE